jgi:hypothetical protein
MSEPYVRPGDHRPRDLAGRLVPHQLDAVTFMRAISGLRDRFQTEVPASHVERREDARTGAVEVLVRCTCGVETPELPVAMFVECPGGCGRWFLNTARSVRVGRLDG